MTERQQQLLIAHGAVVFLLGMAAGFPFAFEIMDPEGIPGDVRGWRMAHLEGVLNGVLLIAVAAAAPKLALTARAATIVFWALVVTAWGNIIASIISPVFNARGLAFAMDMNGVTYTLFFAAIFAVVVAMAIVAAAGFRGR